MTQQLTIEQLRFARSIGATHYDWVEREFRKSGYLYKEKVGFWKSGFEECTYHEYPEIQPIDFSPLDDLEPEYVPKVGEDFLYSSNGVSWKPRTMLFDDGVTMLMACKKYPANRWHYKCGDPDVKFRPIPDPEQQRRDELLSKWRSQSLENAHDTEASVLTVGEMIDFVIELEGD